MPNTYPRETYELVPLTVIDSNRPPGQQTLTMYDTQIVEFSDRPVDTGWTPSVTLNLLTGVMLDAKLFGPGTFRVWVRYTANPEVPVYDAGWFTIA